MIPGKVDDKSELGKLYGKSPGESCEVSSECRLSYIGLCRRIYALVMTNSESRDYFLNACKVMLLTLLLLLFFQHAFLLTYPTCIRLTI